METKKQKSLWRLFNSRAKARDNGSLGCGKKLLGYRYFCRWSQKNLSMGQMWGLRERGKSILTI